MIPKDNQALIDTLLEVSFAKKSVALELADRARTCAGLSNRQRQLLPEIVDHSLSALELLSVGWTRRQALWTGAGSRSLYEASVVAAYVLGSESSAERFYQDGLIDIRDIFESLDAQSASLGGLADFATMIGLLRAEMAQLIQTNHMPLNAKHLAISEIAGEIGAKAEHKLVYQFLSKFSHSSAVTVLTRGGETWLSMVLPMLAYIGSKEYMLMLARIADGTTARTAPA